MEYEFDPESILLDFEQATVNSVTKLFPDAEQKGCLFHMGQCLWRHVQSIGLRNKYINDDLFRLNVHKLIALAFVPVDDVTQAYSSMIIDFDHDVDELLEYFEKTWVGQRKTRGSRRTKPQFPIPLWNVYDRVIRDLPKSNNSVEANCILREQSKFEIDIEIIRVGQEPKPKKKIYATLDSRLKRIIATYNFESINDYLGRVAVNVKLNC
ncbi:unnamed protein product [Adineta ricciae]|nr:unnamed protein product [Adineta ricciae]